MNGPRAARAALLLLGLPACAAPGSWLADRARDFGQCLDADVGWGTGFHAFAGVSHLAPVGLGWARGTRVGLRQGTLGSWREDRSELGAGPLHLHEVDLDGTTGAIVGHRTARFGESGFVSFPLTLFSGARSDRTLGDVGVSVHFLAFGVSLFLRTAELLDALAGLAGLDPSADDLRGRTIEACLADLASGDARRRARADRALRLLTGLDSTYRTYSDPDVVTGEQKTAIAFWEERVGTGDP